MKIKKGDRVRILSGVYVNQIGTVEEISDNRRGTIAVKIPLANRRLVLAYSPRSLEGVAKK